jgi:hypothetical protein
MLKDSASLLFWSAALFSYQMAGINSSEIRAGDGIEVSTNICYPYF